MTNHSAQPFNTKQPAAQIRLPIMLFSSVLTAVLLVLWITASFSSDAADNATASTKKISSAQHVAAGQSTPTLCILPEYPKNNC